MAAQRILASRKLRCITERRASDAVSIDASRPFARWGLPFPRGGNPLSKTPETVQTNRAISTRGAVVGLNLSEIIGLFPATGCLQTSRDNDRNLSGDKTLNIC
jgi:hypothetical protein